MARRVNQKPAKKHRRKYAVFVSHSSADRWIAEVIAERIEKIGATCWLDEKDLEGGDVVVDRIIRGIDSCDEALVLISPQSIQSQWVAFEIGGVRAQHKRVTPILNNVRADEMMPMRDIKGIDLNKFERFLSQLERRVRQSRKVERL